ncbi:DUF6221 family protein [Streptomyces sp. KL116D]|uniref:DUF6221 family protein n=1 Tax=Streptomyces sp. KL116D TaxID=3045152 RepID=UPI003557B0A4
MPRCTSSRPLPTSATSPDPRPGRRHPGRRRTARPTATAAGVGPGAVLADVAAKRGVLRFVERMQQNAEQDDFMVHGPAMVALSATAFPLRHLVAAYAAHPDFT